MAEKRVKAKAFQNAWLEKYALRSTARCSKTSEVVSVVCQFCESYGAEDDDKNPDRKRKRTSNVCFFKKPWRSDHIKRHCETFHPSRFAEYGDLTNDAERIQFFRPDAKYAHIKLFGAASPKDESIFCTIGLPIIDVIVAKLLLEPMTEEEDNDINYEAKALSIFNLNDADADSPYYSIEITNPLLFRLIVSYVACGISFRQCVQIVQQTRETTGIGNIGNVSKGKVIQYIRYLCAMNFNTLSMLLTDCVWAFSIAFDGGNKSDQSYVDVRIRFCLDNQVHNLHLIALPMHERHTGLNMYNLIKKFLDALCSGWTDKLIGISTDGASNMTGRYQGVVTYLCNDTPHLVYRVWCGAHQLDLVVQSATRRLLGGEFVQCLTNMTGNLRRQKNLIMEMKAKCPRFIDTRWMSMAKVLHWFNTKRVKLQQFLDERARPWRPPLHWWITVVVMERVLMRTNVTFTRLQGLTTLLSQQRQCLNELAADFCGDVKAVGPTEFTNEQLADPTLAISGKYAVSMAEAHAFILNEGGLYCVESFEKLSTDEKEMVTRSISEVLVSLIDGISKIVVERDNSNLGSDLETPPCLPHELVNLNGRDFAELLRSQRGRIVTAFDEQELDGLEDEYRELVSMYRKNQTIKEALDGCTLMTSFEGGWGILGTRFPKLKRLCGGFASVFPGTSTVESDFSVIGWEKNEYRTGLTDFSLEGILQCKQYEALTSILKRVDGIDL